MVYRRPRLAPAGRLPEEQRGRVKGRFCLACGSIYPLYSSRHRGKPVYGKDHVASPCSHEGDEFERDAGWWQPAVEVVPRVQEEAPPE